LPVLSWALSADGRSTRITAYDRDGGRWLWTERLTGNLRPAQLSGGVLHLLSTDRDQYTDAVVRLDVRNRTVRRLPLDAPVMQGQASVSGRTVLVSGSGTGSVVALDAESGEQRWRRETMASQL
ncbi:outer membrane protein assembly factor BamB family protein, partial [Streptomyces clavuligerus]